MSTQNQKKIQLFKQVEDLSKEPEFETYYTTPYLTIRDKKAAWALSDELNDRENPLSEHDAFDKMVDFIVSHALKGQVSKSDFEDRYPGSLKDMQELLGFVAMGEEPPKNAKKSQAKTN